MCTVQILRRRAAHEMSSEPRAALAASHELSFLSNEPSRASEPRRTKQLASDSSYSQFPEKRRFNP